MRPSLIRLKYPHETENALIIMKSKTKSPVNDIILVVRKFSEGGTEIFDFTCISTMPTHARTRSPSNAPYLALCWGESVFFPPPEC